MLAFKILNQLAQIFFWDLFKVIQQNPKTEILNLKLQPGVFQLIVS